ncbi:MAG: tyrosine-type recombinase/integrase [Dehalococcoidia bacterium]|nr:tyrosine-type recombinase/integrase [Dehalococcoidia bacterium]
MGHVMRLPSAVSPLLSHAVSQFVADCQLRGLSPRTLYFYRCTLGPFDRYAMSLGCEETASVTEATVPAYLSEKRLTVGASALNGIRDAIRRFFDWAIGEGYADINPAARIGKVRVPRKIVPTFTEAEVQALLDQPDTKTFIGLRDHLFMLLLLDTGIRLSEATGLDLDDIDLDARTIKVMGKGMKERVVGFSTALAYHLQRYLAHRGTVLETVGRKNRPYVFPNAFGARACGRTFQDRIKHHGARAGITRVRVSPHTFRHTFAVMFVRNGGSPFHLQRILGHADLAMSRRYCELADVDFITQHQELSPLTTLDLGQRGQRRLR